MTGTDTITLDTIASNPTQASKLAPEVRAMLLMRAAPAIMALSAGALTTPTPIDGQPLLKVKEVAARLRVSRGHVYEIVKRGDLSAVHVGKALVVSENALNAYIDAHGRR